VNLIEERSAHPGRSQALVVVRRRDSGASSTRSADGGTGIASSTTLTIVSLSGTACRSRRGLARSGDGCGSDTSRRGRDAADAGGRYTRNARGGRACAAALAGERTSDRSRDWRLLDEDARPVPVLSGSVRATVRETQLANVPIRRVGRRAAADAGHDLHERGRAIGRPETARSAAEVDVVREVVPVVGNELSTPLRLTVGVPAEEVVGRTLLAVDQTVLDFREVAFEESDLVLKSGVRRVRRACHEREVVVKVTSADVCRRLRENFGTLHRLAIPERCSINRNFNSQRVAGISRVLEVGGDGKVFRRRARTVDVPLPWLNFVRKGPFVKVSNGERGVEDPTPHNAASVGGSGESREQANV